MSINRRSLITNVALGILTDAEVSQLGQSDRIVTLSGAIVARMVELDVAPNDGGAEMSVSLHCVQTANLTDAKLRECQNFILKLTKGKQLRYHFIGVDRTLDTGPITYGDFYILPEGKNLTIELIRQGYVEVISGLKARRPDLVAVERSVKKSSSNGGTAKSATPEVSGYLITKPAASAPHPFMAASIVIGDVALGKYASVGTGPGKRINLLICGNTLKKDKQQSINICFRFTQTDSDSHKIVMTSSKTSKVVAWMYFDASKGEAVYGGGNGVKGTTKLTPKWHILTYCHGIQSDEVFLDGLRLMELPTIMDACDVIIAPPLITDTLTASVTDIQYIEYSKVRAIASRESIRNLDYNPKPRWPLHAKMFANANSVYRDGSRGTINGLAVTGDGIGVVRNIYATAVEGTGKVHAINEGDRAFQASWESAYAFLQLWNQGRGISLKTRDINVSFGNDGVKVAGNSAGAAMAACMVSAVSDYLLDSHGAVTGAISIRGDVTAVGSVTTKAFAALDVNSIATLIVPFANMDSLRSVFLAKPDQYMTHQVIIAQNMNHVLRHLLLVRDATGRYKSVDDRVNIARGYIIEAMQLYTELKFNGAITRLTQALQQCPEDFVSGLWIDVIKAEYIRIKREENDY